MTTFRTVSLGLLLSSTCVIAQESVGGIPFSQRLGWSTAEVPTVQAAPFDAEAAHADDELRAAAGKLRLYGRFVSTDVDLNNAGRWTELHNGDRVWRVHLVSAGALATELFFSDYVMPRGATVYVYDDAGEQLHGGYTDYNEQANGEFSTDMIFGESCVVEYYEPAEVRGLGYLRIDRIVHAYRDVGPDGTELTGVCEVDVNCPEGANWTEQRDAVMRIRVVIPSGTGYCSGALVNNTAQNCLGYVLTAFHCGEESTDANFSSYQFRWRYQRPSCGTGSASGFTMTGCVRRADSNDGGGHTGSDFMLVELNNAIPPGYTPYYAGWDATGVGSSSGVSIHHPDADVKKISTYASNLGSGSWHGLTSGSHWRVTWVASANGHGVTEGGSSGSPIFNSAKRIIGTLTGGASCCEVNGCDLPGSGPSAQDYYGKMSYHWGTLNPNPAGEELHWWLDPNGLGEVLDGSYDPCSTGIDERPGVAMLALFPNPATQQFTVTYPKDIAQVERLTLTDVTGRVVVNERPIGSGQCVLDVSALAEGSYVAALYANSTLVGSGRLSVQR